MVRWLKIVLPLVALALMSTIFLIDEDQIDLDLPSISELSDTGRVAQSVTDADLSGQTEAGEPYRLLADGLQQIARGFVLDTPRLRLDSQSQGRITVSSAEGLFDTNTDMLDMNGAVEVTVEQSDITLQTEDLRLGVADGALSIISPLVLTFEGGQLSANSARRAGNAPADDTIWFEGDVRLFVDQTPPLSENE